MSERDGRYRMSQGGGRYGDDPDRTQVDRSWTEDFGDYKVGQPYPTDGDDFGPAERSRGERASTRVGASQRVPMAEHTRTESRYEETGYVSGSGQAYARDPRFDGQGGQGRHRPVAHEAYDDDEAPKGYSAFTLALATVAALTVGVVGTILVGGLGNKPSNPAAVASIDPNAATPQQVTELNNQVAQLTATVQERDAQIHNIQTELDRVRTESAANNAAATSASKQAAEAEQRKAELDARESQLNQQAHELNKLAEELKQKQDALNSGGTGGGVIEDAASGAVDAAAGAASEGLGNLINQIRQGIGGQ